MDTDLDYRSWSVSAEQKETAGPCRGDTGQFPSARMRELEREVESLRAALITRDTIGMAKGIIMAREGCTPDGAFDVLRRASQRENRKLAQLAAELVAGNAQRASSGGRYQPKG